MADVIEKVIKVYVEQRTEDERFIDTYRRIGIDPFKERVYAANH
jgi:sulfite reductase (NADPH) hemoprotein beta-component